MTSLSASIGALLAAGALAVAGLLGAGPDRPASPRVALVVDAGLARHGRALLDPRLRSVRADLRLPRTVAEARTDVRYLVAGGDAVVVVAGPRSIRAASDTRARVLRAADLAAALRAVGR
ncbi:MAG: hypothetical protein QOI62_3832 [Solirubrobacteraceae bacterium]|jgi:hypothetical protein|nr:hypothetical protein [Solirubrobacteraceae bacterium]MEA2360572.1 hypothetical protein [Solirubrobacteraceae bacterium]